jgi:hypothetical protein
MPLPHRARRIALLAACGLLGCAADVGPAEGDLGSDEVAASEAALRTRVHVDFESYASGSLAEPWSLTTASTGSTTTASIISASNHGKVLLVKADPKTTDFLIARLGFSSSARELAAQVDVDPSTNAAFVWSVNGTGSAIGKRRVRLERRPGSSTLVASTLPSGNTDCGALPSNAWSRVTLRVHAKQRPHTFDVLIDGKATACTGLETGLGAPWRDVAIMDASNPGWGGEVRLDNIALSTP